MSDREARTAGRHWACRFCSDLDEFEVAVTSPTRRVAGEDGPAATHRLIGGMGMVQRHLVWAGSVSSLANDAVDLFVLQVCDSNAAEADKPHVLLRFGVGDDGCLSQDGCWDEQGVADCRDGFQGFTRRPGLAGEKLDDAGQVGDGSSDHAASPLRRRPAFSVLARWAVRRRVTSSSRRVWKPSGSAKRAWSLRRCSCSHELRSASRRCWAKSASHPDTVVPRASATFLISS